VTSKQFSAVILAAVTLCGGAALAATPDADFTYQGFLSDAGVPADGAYDLQFRVFDAETGGTEVAFAAMEDHPISGGSLTAVLNLGAPDENGAVWLQVEVRPGASTGAFAVLLPRQIVAAAPHAQMAGVAEHATSAVSSALADDADALDGHGGAYYLEWSNHTGLPTGFDDGDDDELGRGTCLPGEVPAWNGIGWICDDDDGLHFARTVTVAADSDPLANGAALLAAVDAMPTPTAQDEAWQVRLLPGEYDLGSASLATKPWTVLVGAGQTATVVTSSACSGTSFPAPTVVCGSDGELRDLQVENRCSSPSGRASAVTVEDRGRVVDVTARASGGNGYTIGIWIAGNQAALEGVRVTAEDGDVTNAIEVFGNAALLLDCEVSATAGLLNRALLAGQGTRVVGGRFTADHGVGAGDAAIEFGSEGELVDVVASHPETAVKIEAHHSFSVRLSRVRLSGSVDAFVETGSSLGVIVEHSTIAALGPTIDGDGGALIAVGGTQLAGGAVDPDGGAIVCAGAWDESWIFYPNTCP
jgi:hypothetical protein